MVEICTNVRLLPYNAADNFGRCLRKSLPNSCVRTTQNTGNFLNLTTGTQVVRCTVSQQTHICTYLDHGLVGTQTLDANKKPVSQKQSRDALPTSLFPGLWRNFEMANLTSSYFNYHMIPKSVINPCVACKKYYRLYTFTFICKAIGHFKIRVNFKSRGTELIGEMYSGTIFGKLPLVPVYPNSAHNTFRRKTQFQTSCEFARVLNMANSCRALESA